MIDAFSHFTPRAVLDRFRELAPALPALDAFERLPALWDLGARVRSLEQFPGLGQILNLGNPPVEMFGSPSVAADLARRANEALALVQAENTELFPAFTAVVPMSDTDLALAEIDHAVGQLGARGIQIYTNVLGEPLSLPRFRPVFERMAQLDLPMLVHPYRTALIADYPSEQASEHEIWFSFGWPYESTAFAARMVYAGIFDQLPELKIVLHHMGGMIPSFVGRIELGFEQIFQGPGAANPVAQRAAITEPVVDHFHRFYADTALNGVAAAVAAGYAFFGPERSLLGTDAPFSPDGGVSFVEGALHAVRALGLDDHDRDRVLDGNARTLFGLPTADPTAAPPSPAEFAR